MAVVVHDQGIRGPGFAGVRRWLGFQPDLRPERAQAHPVAEDMRAAQPRLDRGAPPPPGPVPEWLCDLGEVTPCPPGSLPDGFTSGWRYAAPLAHMPTYLGYLRARFEKAGGRVETATVTSLAAAARDRGARAVVSPLTPAPTTRTSQSLFGTPRR